ncbi:MAG TPA: prepilin-type N-terminal cleavage/methylation domain-containing protein [bacterium]|nr:prepilin-type N-terminal cleavage/methylation domain-containing protein [bacterium]HQM52477.1 prepilin-type N-terminal cleavage/methylation domain-containing protein [bacterium]
MQARRRRSGFTLVEVLFASTLSALLVGGILGTFIAFSRLYRDGSERLCLLSRARYGIERLSSGSSAAEAIAVAQGGNALTVTIPATVLRSAVNATHSSLHVQTAEVFPPSGVVYIDDEAIAYGSAEPKTRRLSSCTRGYAGTTASQHDNRSIVHIRFTYYLDGTTIYFNAGGSPSPASDEPIVPSVEPTGAGGIFRILPGGQDGARNSRVQVAFRCYNDWNRNGTRDASEPSLDTAFEVFARNM